jgi:hypothetical protein
MGRTHFCLVSAQPIPNLIPLRMDELKPEKVILLTSPDMKVQADRLERLITAWGIHVQKYPIEPYDLGKTRDVCMSLLADLENEEVILNVTGGTKIMAFAAFEVFREMERPIIYVDTQDRWIEQLSPAKKRIPFKSVIKVKPYLSSYGQDITEDNTDYERVNSHRAIARELINGIERYEQAIGTMNWYAAPLRELRTIPVEVCIREQDLKYSAFKQLLSLFKDNGIIDYWRDCVVFASPADIDFVSGGWLEEYVFDVVSGLSPTDVKMGVKVKWDQKGPKPTVNEYDVVSTFNNRLFLIECKTKRFLPKLSEGSDRELSNETIYKLESLKEAAGGLYGKGMLVSYRELTDEQKKRLTANKLDFCERTELKKLKERIQKWIK